jgi:hypothetical protein
MTAKKSDKQSVVSRREFVAATAAAGVGLGTAPAAALAQGNPAGTAPRTPSVTTPLPAKGGPAQMYEGTAAGALLAQLKAAGVSTLFHTNTSGFVPFWEAIHAPRATCRSST